MITDKIFWNEICSYIDKNLPLECGYMAEDYKSRAKTCYIIQKLWRLASAEYIKNLKPQDIVCIDFTDCIDESKVNILRDLFIEILFKHRGNMTVNTWLVLQCIVNKMKTQSFLDFLEFYKNLDYMNLLGGFTGNGFGVDSEIEKTWSALKVLIRKKQKEI